MTEDKDKRRKYVHGVANPQIEDDQGTEQNRTQLLYNHYRIVAENLVKYVPPDGSLEFNADFTKFNFGRSSAPVPAGGAYDAAPGQLSLASLRDR